MVGLTFNVQVDTSICKVLSPEDQATTTKQKNCLCSSGETVVQQQEPSKSDYLGYYNHASNLLVLEHVVSMLSLSCCCIDMENLWSWFHRGNQNHVCHFVAGNAVKQGIQSQKQERSWIFKESCCCSILHFCKLYQGFYSLL